MTGCGLLTAGITFLLTRIGFLKAVYVLFAPDLAFLMAGVVFLTTSYDFLPIAIDCLMAIEKIIEEKGNFLNVEKPKTYTFFTFYLYEDKLYELLDVYRKR